MKAQDIYINVARRNDDLPQFIEEYSGQFNLSKVDTFAEILRAYSKFLAYMCSFLFFGLSVESLMGFPEKMP